MLNFNALKLTQRYTLVFVAYWLSLVAVIGMSWYGLVSARDSLRNLHEESLQRILLSDALTETALHSRNQLLLAYQHAPDSPLAALHDHPVTDHLDTVRGNLERGAQMQKELLAKTQDPQEKAMLEEVVRVEEAWNARMGEYITAMTGGNFTPELMQRFLATGREEGDMLVALVGAFKGLQVSKADVAYQEAEQHYHMGLLVFVVAILLGGVPATLLSVSLLRRMRQGFQQAQAASQAIAEGDISQHIHSNGRDEISSLLGQMEAMRTHLHQIIAQVRNGAEAIAGASTQVAAGTQDLSARTEQQASSLEQTAAATEELSGTVQHNADSAVRASELASTATNVAQRGGEMVSQVVQTMEDINVSSRKIEDIIAVIDGIAFQTNILALNAAVEAARAGEQGRGFAVVAGEVRSLAGRSAEAAKEVKTLITASVDRVRVGSEQVHRTGATMQDIVTGIQRVADIVSEIAEASREQSRGLAQINSAVTNLDDVTQQNAALVEETSAASSSLQDQARQLAAMASRFVLDASASGARAAPVAAPRGSTGMGRSALSAQPVDTPALA
ncbi:methyl-accepting chemotaxis protein [Comamonas sp. GB3 AK4-5]|uniref:methyl-accepting chemotaxis protein n=1 Tax=Comamonas sp. GB3 AK4-5 TaxID=3231487 RepID=UPI00351E0EE9